jgi:hypothetical protein
VKYAWLTFTMTLLFTLLVNDYLTSQSIFFRDAVFVNLIQIFPDGSLFGSELFANAVFRSMLALVGSSIIIITALLLGKSNKKIIFSFISVGFFPFLLLVTIFVYLNSHSSNGDHLTYATLSYISLVMIILREHFFFFVQQWFLVGDGQILMGGCIALVFFILLHPLVFNEGRVLGTFLMINLWIYTICVRNLWLGVAIHLAWNFVLPESAIFHYLLIVYSCFLAYGRSSYPIFLVPSWALKWPAFRRFASVWRIVWSYPEQIWGDLRATLFRTSD